MPKFSHRDGSPYGYDDVRYAVPKQWDCYLLLPRCCSDCDVVMTRWPRLTVVPVGLPTAEVGYMFQHGDSREARRLFQDRDLLICRDHDFPPTRQLYGEHLPISFDHLLQVSEWLRSAHAYERVRETQYA